MSHDKKLLPLVIAFVVTVLSLAVAAPASAATIDCDVPLAVDCEISHPDGIQQVTIVAELGNLFDETYDDCPQTVPVSFDAITPNFEIVVVPCKPMGIKADDERDHDRRPGDLKGDDGERVEAVSPYTEYCLKKYPFDPEKAYECSLGWIVD